MITDQFRELAQSSSAQLEQILQVSKGPPFESLAGFEWLGFNTTWLTRLLGIQKFIKGFFQVGDHVEGYNIPVVQNGLYRPWLHRPIPSQPKRYAFYRAAWVEQESRDHFYPDAILLDYNASSRNPVYGVERLLRDYVVQPDPENGDLLLGKAYLALGGLRFPSSFFVLERLGMTSWKP